MFSKTAKKNRPHKNHDATQKRASQHQKHTSPLHTKSKHTPKKRKKTFRMRAAFQKKRKNTKKKTQTNYNIPQTTENKPRKRETHTTHKPGHTSPYRYGFSQVVSRIRSCFHNRTTTHPNVMTCCATQVPCHCNLRDGDAFVRGVCVVCKRMYLWVGCVVCVCVQCARSCVNCVLVCVWCCVVCVEDQSVRVGTFETFPCVRKTPACFKQSGVLRTHTGTFRTYPWRRGQTRYDTLPSSPPTPPHPLTRDSQLFRC